MVKESLLYLEELVVRRQGLVGRDGGREIDARHAIYCRGRG